MTFEETYPLMQKFVRVVNGPWKGHLGYVTSCGSCGEDVVHYGVRELGREDEMCCRFDEIALHGDQNQEKPRGLRIKRA